MNKEHRDVGETRTEGAEQAAPLRLARETVRNLRVKAALRTGRAGGSIDIIICTERP